MTDTCEFRDSHLTYNQSMSELSLQYMYFRRAAGSLNPGWHLRCTIGCFVCSLPWKPRLVEHRALVFQPDIFIHMAFIVN
jgi:hypothetical protein